MWSIRFRAPEALLIGLLALAGPVRGAEVTLHYRAFIAGTPVGEATVEVALVEDRYQVHGTAVSNGWLKWFTNWRNRFAVDGRLEGSRRQPATFSYFEQDSGKTRDLTVQDGVLRVVKNGKPRQERAAPPHLDLISGLFVQPDCRTDQVLSTGRHVYRLTRLSGDAVGCRYTVVDDDDDTFEIELVLGRRNGLVVPTSIKVKAWLSGSIELRDLDHE
jgi:hypothetical protein